MFGYVEMFFWKETRGRFCADLLNILKRIFQKLNIIGEIIYNLFGDYN